MELQFIVISTPSFGSTVFTTFAKCGIVLFLETHSLSIIISSTGFLSFLFIKILMNLKSKGGASWSFSFPLSFNFGTALPTLRSWSVGEEGYFISGRLRPFALSPSWRGEGAVDGFWFSIRISCIFRFLNGVFFSPPSSLDVLEPWELIKSLWNWLNVLRMLLRVWLSVLFR